MRALVVSWAFPNHVQPIHGVFVRERIKALARLCEIHVVAPVPWFPGSRLLRSPWRPVVEAHETQDGLAVDHPKFLSTPLYGKFLDGFLYFLSVWPTVRRLHRTFPFDLIDAHFAYPDGFAAVLLGRSFHKPVTITLRGTIRILARTRVRRRLVTHALQHADAVLAVSQSLKDIAVGLGIDPDKIHVAGNGVDLQRFRPQPMAEVRAQLGLPPGRKILISVGRMIERKGFHRVIELLPALLRSVPDLLYVVAGGAGEEARLRPALDQLIRDHHLGSHVLLTGLLRHDEVPIWLNAADVFCLMTHGEGWANVFLEAMACGKPVVTTRVGGNAEVVATDDVGTLADLDDQPGMVDALRTALARRWDAGAIRRYAEEHSWDHTARQVLPVWQAACRTHQRPVLSSAVLPREGGRA